MLINRSDYSSLTGKYNVPTITYSSWIDANLFEGTWTSADDYLSCTNGDMTLTLNDVISSYTYDTVYNEPSVLFSNTYSRLCSSTTTHNLTFDLKKECILILSFEALANNESSINVSFSASNDNVNWEEISNITIPADTTTRYYYFQSELRYRYYRLTFVRGDYYTRLFLKNLSTTRYSFSSEPLLTDRFEFPQDISYEQNGRTLISVPGDFVPTTEQLNIKFKNTEEVSIQGNIVAGQKYELIYDGENFLVTPHTSIKTGVISDGGVIPHTSIKTGVISDGGVIPQTLGFENHIYFVSPNAGSVQKSMTNRYAIGGVGWAIDCSVNQLTRVVTGKATVRALLSSGSTDWYSATESITVNYLEIAWN